MKRYHIIKDGQLVAAMSTKEEAIDYINRHQERETHYIRSEYGYIYGEEIYIKYKKQKPRPLLAIVTREEGRKQ